MLKAALDSKLFIWGLLALPSLPMMAALASGEPVDGAPVAEALLHPTGEFSARFLIIAMTLSPLLLLFPGSGLLRWMMRRRRYFGVAAFSYAALHTALYIVDMESLAAILGEFLLPGIWTGWLAMFIFIPLAATSNDRAVRSMGPRWKSLQRLVYIAAMATLLHWIFVHNQFGPALAHFLPLAALEAYRLYKYLTPRETGKA